MYNDRQSTKIRMKRTSVPTLCPCGEGRRLEATLRLVHQQGEDREITREARAKGVLIASLHTLRLKVLEEGHPSCQQLCAVCAHGTSAHDRSPPIRKDLACAPTNHIGGTNFSLRNNFRLKKEAGRKKTIV